MFNFTKWPVTLVVVSVRADGGRKVEIDKARKVIKRDKQIEWRRRKRNELLPPLPYKDLSDNDVIFLKRDKEGQYGYMEVNATKGTITGIDSNVLNWALYKADMDKKMYEKSKFWKEHLPAIMGIATLMLIGIVVYIVFGQFLEASRTLNSAITVISTSCHI